MPKTKTPSLTPAIHETINWALRVLLDEIMDWPADEGRTAQELRVEAASIWINSLAPTDA